MANRLLQNYRHCIQGSLGGTEMSTSVVTVRLNWPGMVRCPGNEKVRTRLGRSVARSDSLLDKKKIYIYIYIYI